MNRDSQFSHADVYPTNINLDMNLMELSAKPVSTHQDNTALLEQYHKPFNDKRDEEEGKKVRIDLPNASGRVVGGSYPMLKPVDSNTPISSYSDAQFTASDSEILSVMDDIHEENMSMDEMKIQTMYKMVDDCTITINGREVPKKVLYLTNKQACLFDEHAMERCIEALDLGQPKFIISLLISCGVRSQMERAHQEEKHKASSEYETTTESASEICFGDERVTETQILLFLRSCLLPLAKQTHALIVVGGANDCYLSSALADVVLNEQARLGKDCPFTVLATVFELEIHHKACTASERGSVAAQVAKHSNAWRRRMSRIHEKHYSKKESFWSVKRRRTTNEMQQCDLTAAASRYIIFESIDEGPNESIIDGKINIGPAQNFTAVFLHAMTKKLPSIAIQAFAMGLGVSHLVDLTSRNIPVLLLDCTERAITLNSKTEGITQVARESDAFPLIPLERVKKMKIVNQSLSLEGRSEIYRIAEEMIERKWKSHIEHGVGDQFDTSLLAFLHTALKLGEQLTEQTDQVTPLYRRIKDLQELHRTNKAAQKMTIPEELTTKAVNFLQTRVRALAKFAQLSRLKSWLKKHDSAVDHLVHGAEERLVQIQAECDAITAAGGCMVDESVDKSVWLNYFDILTSPNTFSSSIFDIDELKRIMGSVAKIDRLPESNSLEALLALQTAWDLVELYNNVADVYKVITHICYILLILVSFLVILCTVLELRLIDFSSRLPIIVLGFISTAIVAFVSFANPAVRWQQLRIGALSIESNIWIFRTRSGPYRTSGEGFDAAADTLFIETLKHIKQTIHDTADLKNTKFFGKSLKLGKYGQHENSSFSTVQQMRGEKTEVSTRTFDLSTLIENEQLSRVVEVPQDEVQGTPYGYLSEFSSLESGMKFSSANKGVPLTTLVKHLGRKDAKEINLNDRDSHYEPAKPEFYIQHRVMRLLRFYKSRIPRYNNLRNIIQLCLVLGSIAIAALPFFNQTNLAALVSIFSSGIAAYLEFHGTNSKINRYSSIIHDLEGQIEWWKTLPQIEKSVVSNIDKLVVTCEDLIQRERQAWQSTSQAVKQLEAAKQNVQSTEAQQ